MTMHGYRGEISIEVTVERAALLERLRGNREAHQARFEAAIAAWQAEMAAALAAIDTSACTAFPASLAALEAECPTSHVDAYDQAIDMFEMCTNETIKLDSEAFATFCRDAWDWKQSVSVNRYYQRSLR